MGKSETRLNQLEQNLSPVKGECMVVYFADWDPADQEPPAEEIKCTVSFFDNRKPEIMSLAEYRKRFLHWEDNLTVRVEYTEGLRE